MGGWIGLHSQVIHYLHTVGADRDVNGQFLLDSSDGSAVCSFMGAGEELVIPPGVCYLRHGQRVPLAAGLQETSYGLGVTVIS